LVQIGLLYHIAAIGTIDIFKKCIGRNVSVFCSEERICFFSGSGPEYRSVRTHINGSGFIPDQKYLNDMMTKASFMKSF